MESAVFSKEDAGVVAETVVMSPYAQVPEDAARYTEVREAYVEDPADADCRPGSATPRVRKPDPKVTRAVNRQWRRIETWLKANAPRSYRTLGKPAKAGTIAVAEAQMGLRFPDDLKASLLRHNGVVPVRDTWGGSASWATGTWASVRSATPGGCSAGSTAWTGPGRATTGGTGG
ncbi:hypothetical protein ACFSTC_04110 [Nonomuraea ferruginea]